MKLTRENLPLKIRHATDEDISFIFNSWLKSFRNGALCREVSNTVYFAGHHKLLESLIPKCQLLIACSPEDSSQIYSYIVFTRIDGVFVCHYIYTKHTYRRLGVAKALLELTGYDKKTLSCFTHYMKSLEKKYEKYSMVYHPYLLFSPDSVKEADVGNTEKLPD